MANRAMAAKVTRAKREARESVHKESTKACYIQPKFLSAIDLATVDTFNGRTVLKIPAGLKGRKGAAVVAAMRSKEQRERFRAHI